MYIHLYELGEPKFNHLDNRLEREVAVRGLVCGVGRVDHDRLGDVVSRVHLKRNKERVYMRSDTYTS